MILVRPARRDRYEKDVKLYWVERSISGKMVKLGLCYEVLISV